MAQRYFNPYTDFGFKKLFGEEANKELLVDFLNQLLPPHHQIAQLQFKNAESLPDTFAERKAIFDIYCESADGHKFIVEMQKAKLNYFKDRTLFYLTFPIREQAEKGAWDFRLLPIYLIAILDFEYDEHETRKFFRDVCLKDQDGEVFYEKLQLKFIQIPLFNKAEAELENRFDKWLYFLKHLGSLEAIPTILNEPIFQKGFEVAELALLSAEQHEQYKKSLLQYREIKAVTDTAFAEGKAEGLEEGLEKGLEKGKAEGLEEGRAEGKREIAKEMKAQQIPIPLIAKLTGFTEEEIIAL